VDPVALNFSAEGTTITFATVVRSGYPMADANLATAAGLSANDYTITVAGTTLTVSPVSAPAASMCKVVYTEPLTTTTAPDITSTATILNC
jgi:MSHA pilin protein MshA